MPRKFIASVLAVLSLALFAGPVSALDAPATLDDEDGVPYVCVRSHLLLGKDNPICIKYTPPSQSADA